MYLETSKTKTKLYKLAGFSLLAFMAIAFLRGAKNGCVPEERETSKLEQLLKLRSKYDDPKRCNLFSGRWVFDNVSNPLYEERECSFMLDDHACTKFGRKDVRFHSWRWQPRHCDLPRFNGTALLEKIRGKRVVFVGDSLNKNQWASMLCLIESSLNQSSNKTPIKKGNLLIFEAIEYNATIEFYWSPFLVESNCDDPFHHSNLHNRTVSIFSIEKHARQWSDADLLVFDSFAWWLEPNITLWTRSKPFGNSIAIGEKVETISKLQQYEMALNTWSDWLEVNINRTKTKLFFMGPSPFHTSRDASGDVVPICHKKTEPSFEEDREWGTGLDRDIMRIANSVVLKLKRRGLEIEYLNITEMSDYRVDAHPSIYRKFFHPLSENQLSNPKNYADCLHWCLPGLPDVWNQILYSYIIRS